jgi:hypothetical protein
MPGKDGQAVWLPASLRTPFVGVNGPFANRDSLALSVPTRPPWPCERRFPRGPAFSSLISFQTNLLLAQGYTARTILLLIVEYYPRGFSHVAREASFETKT